MNGPVFPTRRDQRETPHVDTRSDLADTPGIDDPPAAPEVTSERLARRWFALVREGSLERLQEMLHEDVVIVSKVRPGEIVEGREAVAAFVESIVSHSLYDAVADDYTPLDEERVVIEGRMRATPRVVQGQTQVTQGDGWATLTLVPNAQFPQPRNGFNVQFFVKAYRAGDPGLGGIAGYRLVQVRLANGS